MRVAQEAWQLEAQPPGCAFWSFDVLLDSAEQWKKLKKPAKKSKATGNNLLDYLRPEGLEARLVQGCHDLGCVNPARARLVLQALRLLTRSAARHDLVSGPEAAAMQQELSRLQGELDRSFAVPDASF